MTDIDKTLAERGARYGRFAEHAQICQKLKDVMRATPGWARLAADQKEALEMVQHKIGRILNGDPNFHDSWHDIVGYTKLVADRLLAPLPIAVASKGDARQPACSLSTAVRAAANGHDRASATRRVALKG